MEVDGFPTPTVEWYKDGRLVPDSRTLRMYYDGRVAFLKIYEATLDQQGEYVCRVRSSSGTVETRATLIVEREFAYIILLPTTILSAIGPPLLHIENMPRFVTKLPESIVAKLDDQIILSVQVNSLRLRAD